MDTWNDPQMITEGQGFPITRSLARLQELWENLEKDRKGEVIKRLGDSVPERDCATSLSRDVTCGTSLYAIRLGNSY